MMSYPLARKKVPHPTEGMVATWLVLSMETQTVFSDVWQGLAGASNLANCQLEICINATK